MTSPNPDQMQPLGTLPDLDFSTDTPVYMDRPVHRDYDHVIIPSARLDRYGRNCLRALLDQADNEIARYRLRTLDYDIDIDLCREDIADLLCLPKLPDMESVDWVDVGRRLASAGPYLGELRRLHALLMADETPAPESAS